MPALRNKIRVREKRKDSVKSEVASRLQEGHRPESRRNSFAVLLSFHCLLFSLSLFFSDRATLRGRRREARKGGIEFRDSRLGSRRIYPGSSREEALGRRPRISIARKEKRRRRGIEEGRKKENRSTFRSRCHSAREATFAIAAAPATLRIHLKGHKVLLLLSLDSFALENPCLRRRKSTVIRAMCASRVA